jgi:hypothetical protein
MRLPPQLHQLHLRVLPLQWNLLVRLRLGNGVGLQISLSHKQYHGHHYLRGRCLPLLRLDLSHKVQRRFLWLQRHSSLHRFLSVKLLLLECYSQVLAVCGRVQQLHRALLLLLLLLWLHYEQQPLRQAVLSHSAFLLQRYLFRPLL